VPENNLYFATATPEVIHGLQLRIWRDAGKECEQSSRCVCVCVCVCVWVWQGSQDSLAAEKDKRVTLPSDFTRWTAVYWLSSPCSLSAPDFCCRTWCYLR